MLVEIVLLLIGLVVLVKSSDLTIRNAAKLSQLTGLSQIVIGFIFIAVATSLPELAIGIISSLKGEGILSVGNLIGANISNLALVFGIMAFFGFNLGKIYSVRIEQTVIVTSGIALFMIILGQIGLAFGLFCLLIFYLFSSSVVKEGVAVEVEEEVKTPEIVKTVLVLLFSVAVVIVSAHLVTVNAIAMANIFGIAESIIGATILAIGTTLPELSVNITAVRKGNISLAIGDIVGSTITNLTLIMGIVSFLNPMILNSGVTILLLSLIAVNAIFFLLTRRMKFGYKEGLFLLGVYATYLSLLFIYFV